jgi:hypothetical protein
MYKSVKWVDFFWVPTFKENADGGDAQVDIVTHWQIYSEKK